MDFLCERFLENDPAKYRLSGADYERFMKSMQLMSSINLAGFVEGVTMSELSLLYAAADFFEHSGEPISVAEAAGRLGISVPAVSRTLKSLEQKGLIRRQSDERDRRSVKLFVTDEGAQAVERNVAVCFELMNRVMAQFSDEELRAMVNLHCKLTKALSEEARQFKKR